MIGTEPVTQQELHEDNQKNGSDSEQAKQVSLSGSAEAVATPSEPSKQHAEAGRKGARRVHQLIQQGKLYEREHGLKPGRQRLRQLIQEGKLYEQEHGLKAGSTRAREGRRPRISHEQMFKSFLQALLRLAKPAYRDRILSLLQVLEAESK